MTRKISSAQLRIGISIWILSWLPFPILIVEIAHRLGAITSPSATSLAYAILWGGQIVIGLIGLAIAGKETIDVARSGGWRGTPKRLWALIRHGNQAQ